MPKGVKGFQPGRPKTGGRQKGSVNTARRSARFLERLKGYGFNYDAELADVLKKIKALGDEVTGDAKSDAAAYKRATELKFFYGELKSLLPYMTPKLREKEVETVDAPDDPLPDTPIATEDLLKALDKNEEKVQPRNSSIVSPTIPSSATSSQEKLVGEEEE